MPAPLSEPLRLRPLLKDYLWGGRRLGELLGKPLREGQTCAESWEAVDHPDGQSVVEGGPHAGRTLGELARSSPRALYGDELGAAPPERFPLLLKYLDAQKTLSVQVHPDDAGAALLDPPDLGKTEAWVVLHADPGAKIYAGLAPGADRAALAASIARGDCDAMVHSFEPSVGDCIYLPAGTVHALGAGLVIAEVQQASNTTFRLYDWNRIDKDGKPRPLHIEASLAAIDYARGPVAPQQPKPAGPGAELLVACEKFVLTRRTLAPGADAELAPCDRFRLLTVVAGAASLAGAWGAQERLGLGQTVLAPAAAGGLRLRAASPAGAVLLEARLP